MFLPLKTSVLIKEAVRSVYRGSIIISLKGKKQHKLWRQAQEENIFHNLRVQPSINGGLLISIRAHWSGLQLLRRGDVDQQRCRSSRGAESASR